MPTNTELDQNPFREKFYIADPNQVYLDGNSLGRLPYPTVALLTNLVEVEWGQQLISGWNQDWLSLPARIGEKIGKLIGAKSGETFVSDSTSVNLFKLATALIAETNDRNTILTDTTNFPTDIYVLKSAAVAAGQHHGVKVVELTNANGEYSPEKLDEALNGQVALVSLSHVNFKTGSAFDLPQITQRVHQSGAKILWDLSHSAGVMPIDLQSAKVDAAVGCTYKYLNGGPGAPAFLTVREDLRHRLVNPIQGWFGSDNPFAFSSEYSPSHSISRFAVGTPPILSMAAIEPGVDLVLNAGIDWVRDRSLMLTELFFELFDDRLAKLGYWLQTPRIPELRGSHVSLGHEYGWQITQDLINRHKVVPDFRSPETIRFGITPLYTLGKEIERAVTALESSVVNMTYREFPSTRTGVT